MHYKRFFLQPDVVQPEDGQPGLDRPETWPSEVLGMSDWPRVDWDIARDRTAEEIKVVFLDRDEEHTKTITTEPREAIETFLRNPNAGLTILLSGEAQMTWYNI